MSSDPIHELTRRVDLLQGRLADLERLIVERTKPQPDPWRLRLRLDLLERLTRAELERTLEEIEAERAELAAAAARIRGRLGG